MRRVVRTVPSEVNEGSAKHFWVLAQRWVISHCPSLHCARALEMHAVSSSCWLLIECGREQGERGRLTCTRVIELQRLELVIELLRFLSVGEEGFAVDRVCCCVRCADGGRSNGRKQEGEGEDDFQAPKHDDYGVSGTRLASERRK